jgi:acetyl esterase/lipase
MAQMHEQLRAQAEDSAQWLDKRIHEIDGEDGKIRLFVYQAKNREENVPAMLWIHGGGYISGDANDLAAESYAQHCACTFVSVEYRLAPEHLCLANYTFMW